MRMWALSSEILFTIVCLKPDTIEMDAIIMTMAITMLVTATLSVKADDFVALSFVYSCRRFAMKNSNFINFGFALSGYKSKLF